MSMSLVLASEENVSGSNGVEEGTDTLPTSLSSPTLSTMATPLENGCESPTPGPPAGLDLADGPFFQLPPAGLDLADGRGKVPVYATVNKVRQILSG